MNPTIQPGTHPDAESLTAFAEQLLPAPEREQILVHMSSCSRCREVVFLAQEAAEEEQPVSVALATAASRRLGTSWFNWKWAWIPAAVCAGIIGVAVVQRSQRLATERQATTDVAQMDALRATASPTAVPQNPAAQKEPKAEKTAKSSRFDEERESVRQIPARDEAKKLDENKPSDRKILTMGASPPPVVLAPGAAGGSLHGTMAARTKSAPFGGPLAANEFQQQNAANQQNLQQQSSPAQLDAAKGAANAAAAARSESETVTVQAQSVIPTQTAPSPAQVNVTPITEQDYASRLGNAAGFQKKQNISLPSGLEALSVANDADRTIAIDIKGALFVSENQGKRWKPVRTQWTGRAVLVRNMPAAQKDKALTAMKTSPTAKFQLVTDDLQTWISADGNIWTLQPMPGK